MSRLYEKTRRQMVSAIHDYGMLEEGDHVMVAVSGGKDSAVLLKLLVDVQVKAPFSFQLTPVILDQKQPGFSARRFADWVTSQTGLELTILHEDTHSIVREKVAPGKSFCGLCSRLRRGILYNYAAENGMNKIALGHHRDDMNETLLLNLFFNGRLAAMPPKLRSDDERNIIIRPLAYVPEPALVELAKEWAIPTIPCNLCGSQDNLQRGHMKSLLQNLEKQYPTIRSSMLAAQQNVRRSQLADRDIWSFEF